MVVKVSAGTSNLFPECFTFLLQRMVLTACVCVCSYVNENSLCVWTQSAPPWLQQLLSRNCFHLLTFLTPERSQREVGPGKSSAFWHMTVYGTRLSQIVTSCLYLTVIVMWTHPSSRWRTSEVLYPPPVRPPPALYLTTHPSSEIRNRSVLNSWTLTFDLSALGQSIFSHSSSREILRDFSSTDLGLRLA